MPRNRVTGHRILNGLLQGENAPGKANLYLEMKDTLRGGFELPRGKCPTGFPGLRLTARLPQQKMHLNSYTAFFLMLSPIWGHHDNLQPLNSFD